MYRLVLYVLIVFMVAAFGFSVFGLLPYSPYAVIESVLFLVIVAWITNTTFAKVFETPANVESAYITALILGLIITPPTTLHGFIFLFWAAVLAMSSKFILSLHKKHIFNPAAIAVALTSIGLSLSANWWVGTTVMVPFICIGGLLIVRKIQREDMVLIFFSTVIVLSVLLGISKDTTVFRVLNQLFFHSSMLFFAFIMLTEPLTMPSRKKHQLIFAALVGILFLPQVHVLSIYSTPEIALIIGNIYAYLVSPKGKLFLRVKEIIDVAPGITDFVFESKHKLAYLPGQYMEWTLGHTKPDSRGNRRYFTLASSPTENSIRLGVKFYRNQSSFKHALHEITEDSVIVAHQVAGDFVLPENKKEKLVFIAGGIGITPFRSMIKYLSDKGEKRDVILLYSNRTADEIAYKEVFDEATHTINLKTVYTITDHETVPKGWTGKIGRIGTHLIKEEVPDFAERTFYLSGTNTMVTAMETTLKAMGVKGNNIRKDFFPGLA